MKALKIDNTGSVLIQSNDLKVWVDVYEDDKEIYCDWNQYIFFLNNSIDLEIKAFQENIDNAREAFGLATEYYIQHKK